MLRHRNDWMLVPMAVLVCGMAIVSVAQNSKPLTHKVIPNQPLHQHQSQLL
jgi:hypothetical protein